MDLRRNIFKAGTRRSAFAALFFYGDTSPAGFVGAGTGQCVKQGFKTRDDSVRHGTNGTLATSGGEWTTGAGVLRGGSEAKVAQKARPHVI